MTMRIHPETRLLSVLSGRPVIHDQATNKKCYLDNRQEVKFPPEFTEFTEFTELSNGSILWYGKRHQYQIQMTNGEYSQRYEIPYKFSIIKTVVELQDNKIAFGAFRGLCIIDITKPKDVPLFHIDCFDVKDLLFLEGKNKLLVSTGRKIITVDLTTMSVLGEETYSFSSNFCMIEYNGEVLTTSRDGIKTLSGTVYSEEDYIFSPIIKLRSNVFVVAHQYQPNAIEIWVNGVKRHTLGTFAYNVLDIHRINSYSFAVHVIERYMPAGEEFEDSRKNFTLIWTDTTVSTKQVSVTASAAAAS